MDKDAVSNLNVTELAGFPLDDFFDHYEKGLRKVRIRSICNYTLYYDALQKFVLHR